MSATRVSYRLINEHKQTVDITSELQTLLRTLDLSEYGLRRSESPVKSVSRRFLLSGLREEGEMASFAGLLSHPVAVSSLLDAVSTLTDKLAAVVTPAGGGAAARRTRPPLIQEC